MIIENLQKSNVELVGDIQQIKASIDVQNIEFITTLLSSNLYSNPIQSFLREIVSNAWDSHVEAHNEKEPVIVKVEAKSVTIRDYGTGLSKEDFEELYCKIGSSSKRESNAYIGAFGLGHLSPLAVSDVVYISSYYNGKIRHYVMIKENGNITTNYLGETDTEEHNGLMVTVPVNEDDYETVVKALKYLVFFPNIYVEYLHGCDSDYNINSAKVTRYKKFSVSSVLRDRNAYTYGEKVWCLLGNVLYPLDLTKLNISVSYDGLKELKKCNICLNVNIGEINVTPNRESIIYSENTIRVLSDRLMEATYEIRDILEAKGTIDYTELPAYYNAVSDTEYWHPLNDTIDNNSTEGIEHIPNVTYKGEKKSDEFIKNLIIFCKKTVPGFRNMQVGRIVCTGKGLDYHSRRASKVTNNKFYAIEDNRNVSGYLKHMILNDGIYYMIPIIEKLDEEEFIKRLVATSYIGVPVISKIPDEELQAAKEVYKWVDTHTSVITVKDINDYRKGIKDSLPKNGKRTDTSLHSLHKFEFSNYDVSSVKITREAVRFDKIIDILKSKSKVILHNGKDIVSKDQVKEYKVLNSLGWTIVWCSNSLYNKIIKYMAANTNKKHLSGIRLDYKSILTNPSANTECFIAMSRLWAQTFDSSSTYNRQYVKDTIRNIKSLIPDNKEFLDIFNSMSNREYRASELLRSDYYKLYKVKTPKAIWLENYIRRISPIWTYYWGISGKLRSAGLGSDFANNIVAKYLTAKWCVKNHINIDFKEYRKLKIDTLIRLLYE